MHVSICSELHEGAAENAGVENVAPDSIARVENSGVSDTCMSPGKTGPLYTLP